MKRFLIYINIAAVAMLALAYLAPYTDPREISVVSSFGLLYPLILLLNLFFMIMWLMMRSNWLFLSLIFVLIGSGALIRYMGFGSAKSGKTDFTVMSYNIGKTWVGFAADSTEGLITDFQSFLRKHNPDILCVQERSRFLFDMYDRMFEEYTVWPKRETGTAIITKLPIKQSGNVPLGGFAHNATWADIEINPGQIFRIYSIHLYSNRVSPEADQMMHSPNWDIQPMWARLSSMLTKYSHSAETRAEQLEKILTHIKQSPHPVILAGDFNDVPQSYVYRQFSADFMDAYIECNTGFEKTYDSFMPGLRIDYTFAQKPLKPISHKVLEDRLSDHFPIMTHIAWSKPNKT